ncbi:E3 ubiquitin-protein ligase TRIM47-like [Gadus macrocephalus]|uniref:E3 ubiquitin-protein ligase TRIM47-like n=1 Tax=Gadus macrocephalus TaxID=80720 RepID=UPI0028CB2020|nr:E3 ubiquitin-protein ligase TRIM47-like [Gadus macrocephalus]
MATPHRSWSEENFSCPICLDVFNSPVSTPCGHNFCTTCVTTFWDDKDQYKCPVCNEIFQTRPDLRVNTLLSEMVDQFRTFTRVKEQQCVEPGEVPCDVCTGTQLKAVKSCLVCFISYCQTHLEPHQRVTVLKSHELVEPMNRLENRMCKKHNQLLELFCQTEQVCVCQLCTVMDHKSHPVVPLKEEYELKTAQLGKIESEVQQMIQERQQKIQEIKDTVGLIKADGDRVIADGEEVLIALMLCIAKCRDDLNEAVKDELKSTEEKAEGLIKELEQEIELLINRCSESKQFSQSEDHLHFLQNFMSLNNPPSTRDWTTVEVRHPSYIGTLSCSMDQLKETLDMEMKKMPDLHSALKKYACKLTLDKNTVYRRIALSDENRKATMDGEQHRYPNHPERFDTCGQVLCREGLTGRCYWEVEREGCVSIGVTYRGIKRKGGGSDSRLGGYYESWRLQCTDDYYKACGNNIGTKYPPIPYSDTVGIYLDRPAGTLSFYIVGRYKLTHIHTFNNKFTQDLYPGFLLGNGTSVRLRQL